MNTQRTSRRLLLVTALALALSVFAVASVSADSGSATYDYLIGTGLLCGFPPELLPCPAIAMADNGDTIEITGAGTLGIHPKSADGEGTFTHKLPDGTVVGSGTWTAQDLLSFKGYGCGGPGLPDNFCGGRAVMRVHLVSSTGLESDGILQVDCLIGKFPAGAVEGVRLVVQAFDFNFNKEVSGFTLFILE